MSARMEMTMAEYIERTEELVLAMNAGARAIENTRRYHGAVYSKNVFSETPQEIPYLLAAKVLRGVEDAPAANVAPVVHAEWVVCGDGDNVPWMCSHCGKTTAHKYKVIYGKYCPHCGAKMDGGDNTER